MTDNEKVFAKKLFSLPEQENCSLFPEVMIIMQNLLDIVFFSEKLREFLFSKISIRF